MIRSWLSRLGPHFWVPTLLSGLLLLAFFPLIFQLGKGSYVASTGLVPSGYLARWVIATVVLYAISGAIWLLRRARHGHSSD